MPQGFVTTARGEILNMDQLKTQATMPIAEKKQPGREIKRKAEPKRKPLNVRGYLPQVGEAKAPELSDEVRTAMESKKVKPTSSTIRASFADDGEAKSLADVTGIKVDKPSAATKQKVKAALENEKRPAEAASETLGDILSELEETNPKAVEAADEEEKVDTVRRTRSKKE